MSPALPLLVFTDLDGTLLDHHSYDFTPALPALEALRAASAGVVLASSKTAAEMAPLRRVLGLDAWPAIVENGAGVLPPGTDALRGTDYARLRTALDALPADLRAPFRGFGDMTPAEIAESTGLPEASAAAAGARQFSEPGLWSGSAAGRDDFRRALAEKGVQSRRGGRFLTLSFGATKADRMAEISAALQPGVTVALGDAPNDVEMLEAADHAVIVANPLAPPLPELTGEAAGRIRRTTETGPHGWNAAMTALLSELGLAGRGAHG